MWLRGWREGAKFPPLICTRPHPARGRGQLLKQAQGEQWHCPLARDTSPQKPCKTQLGEPPGFKGKELRGERDHTQDVTLWVLAKKALPSPPRARDGPGRHKGCLLVLLHVQQDPIHPVYFGKSNDSDALSQQERVSPRNASARAPCRLPAAQRKAKFSPRSAPCTIPVLVPRTAQRLGERARVNQPGLDSCRIFPPFCHLLKEIIILWHL